MRKLSTLAAALLGIALLTGCSQGGGDCGGILQYCEPEETSSAPLDPGGGAVPPGEVGGTGQVVGAVTLLAGMVDPNQRAVNLPVTVTVGHTLANQNDIPVVQDPFTKVMMPSPYTFTVPETPFSYTAEIKSDTIQIDFTVTGSIRTNGAVTCVLYNGAVEIPGSARVAFAGAVVSGVPTVSVTCSWILGM